MIMNTGPSQQHEAFVDDLASALDFEAGLRDAFQHLAHEDLVSDAGEALNVEAGLASALNQLDERGSPVGEPEVPPEAEPSTGSPKEQDSLFELSSHHSPHGSLDSVSCLFDEVFQCMEIITSTPNRDGRMFVRLTKLLKSVEGGLEAHTISERDAIESVNYVRGWAKDRAPWNEGLGSQMAALEGMLSILEVAIHRLFDHSNESAAAP